MQEKKLSHCYLEHPYLVSGGARLDVRQVVKQNVRRYQ